MSYINLSIIEEFLNSHYSAVQISKHFNISNVTIGKIRNKQQEFKSLKTSVSKEISDEITKLEKSDILTSFALAELEKVIKKTADIPTLQIIQEMKLLKTGDYPVYMWYENEEYDIKVGVNIITAETIHEYPKDAKIIKNNTK